MVEHSDCKRIIYFLKSVGRSITPHAPMEFSLPLGMEFILPLTVGSGTRALGEARPRNKFEARPRNKSMKNSF